MTLGLLARRRVRCRFSSARSTLPKKLCPIQPTDFAYFLPNPGGFGEEASFEEVLEKAEPVTRGGVGGRRRSGGGSSIGSSHYEAKSPFLRSSRDGSGAPLAEDIKSIRLFLEGSSVDVKEKILKILERLTERVARAEAERDSAWSEYKQL